MSYPEPKKLHKNICMKLIGIPNLLTILRISLIPIFILAFYWPTEWRFIITTAIFGLAAITDWLDGYLARRLSQVSPMGAFLDPVADKLIAMVALILLVEQHANVLIAIPVAVIVCREIAISALREWMAKVGSSAKVAVSYLGKIKTTMQMVAILILLSQPPVLENKIVMLGYVCLYVALVFTVWSMYKYLCAAWRNLAAEN